MGEYKMPSLGSQMIKARLIKWHVKPGDTVHKGDVIGEIDTEKGLIDIEVFEDGTVTELVAEEGEVIPVGGTMAIINGDRTSVEAVAKPKQVETAPPRSESKHNGNRSIVVQEESPRLIKASPLARKVAKQLQVDLTEVRGTGYGGTIHKDDVERHAGWVEAKGKHQRHTEVKEKASKQQKKDTEEQKSEGPTLRAMRRAIAQAMTQSNKEIPQYYLETEINMRSAMEWLSGINADRSINDRILPPVLLIKAIAESLSEVPELNGYWKDEALQIQEAINIGFAISLRSGGLVIPAILNADVATLDEIRDNFVDLVHRARNGHLKGSEINSGTVTVTSLGEQGADKVFGIIYPPQVALVGLGSIKDRPIAIDGNLGVHPTITATLTGDHRATDGHIGSRFLQRLSYWLNQPDEFITGDK